MNDSRTLELYKSGHYIRALARTTMYGLWALFGLVVSGLFISVVGLLVAAFIVSPALMALMQMMCQVTWG